MDARLLFHNKRFSPLLWTQFFGALNDNFLKNALVILITYKGVSLWGMDSAKLVAFAGGIFILPFFLFSPIAGQISDKHEKSRLVVWTKWLEVLIVIAAAIGFTLHHFELLLAALFLMGLQSTFFGPVKYSIIPDLVTEHHLTGGNALIEVGTFLAILIGTIAGGLSSNTTVISIGLIMVAALGLICSYKVPHVSPADPDHKLEFHPIRQLKKATQFASPHPTVFYSVIGISWFWFFGAGILSVLPVLTKDLLAASQEVVTFFLTIFTVGIALGALICSKISRQKADLGLVPLGALGMTLMMCDFAWALSNWTPPLQNELLDARAFFQTPGSFRLSFDLLMISVFGGLFTVPLYTVMQERTDRRVRSRVVAANNIFNALFMVMSSLMLMAFYSFDIRMPYIILSYGILNLILITLICMRAPEYQRALVSYFQNK